LSINIFGNSQRTNLPKLYLVQQFHTTQHWVEAPKFQRLQLVQVSRR